MKTKQKQSDVKSLTPWQRKLNNIKVGRAIRSL
jgi:hypothetical protein